MWIAFSIIKAYRKTAKHENANYPQILCKAMPSGSDSVSKCVVKVGPDV